MCQISNRICMKSNDNKSLNATLQLHTTHTDTILNGLIVKYEWKWALFIPYLSYTCMPHEYTSTIYGIVHWFYMTLVGISMKLNNAELQWKSSVWQIKELLVRWLHFAIRITLVFQSWSNGVCVCVCMLLWIDATIGKQAAHKIPTIRYANYYSPAQAVACALL